MSNQRVQEAIGRGEDTTGLCTVREVVAYMLDEGKRRPHISLSQCEMYFPLPGYKRVNVVIDIINAEEDDAKETA